MANNEKVVAHQLPTNIVNLFYFNRTIGRQTFRKLPGAFFKPNVDTRAGKFATGYTFVRTSSRTAPAVSKANRASLASGSPSGNPPGTASG